jgi:polyferredoxin
MSTATSPTGFVATKKVLIRRIVSDHSQRTRHIVQACFIALNAWLGIEFFLWVRSFELATPLAPAARPAGVDGWLPIAGLMNLKYFLVTGKFPAVHPAAMYLFVGFLLMSLLVKKAFCSWLCPVGTFSEYLARFGHWLFRRNLRLPRWLDIPLRALKYLLLAFFVVFVAGMSAEMLAGFMNTPYGIIADVKMLTFFRDLSMTAGIVLASLFLLSMLIQNFWCRYLCPYGALLGLASLLSPLKIRRDTEACIDCGKCARACPASLPVDRLVQIRSAECTACMVCMDACPAENGLQFALPPRVARSPAGRWYRRAFNPVAVTWILAYIFFGIILLARATDHWQTNIPREVYTHLVPHAKHVSHPSL